MYTGKQIQIDEDNRRFRKFSRFLHFIKLGDFWESFPDSNYELSVSKVNLTTLGNFGEISNNTHTKCYTYRVYLRCKTKNIIIYDGGLKKAKKEAEKLSKYFNLKVIDYTNQEENN